MARIKVATIPEEVDQALPAQRSDSSRVGVNYADAFGRAINNAKLPDGRTVNFKRRGLQLTLTIGDRSASALLDRLAGNENPQTIFPHTMEKIAGELGYHFIYEDRIVYLEEA